MHSIEKVMGTGNQFGQVAVVEEEEGAHALPGHVRLVEEGALLLEEEDLLPGEHPHGLVGVASNLEESLVIDADGTQIGHLLHLLHLIYLLLAAPVRKRDYPVALQTDQIVLEEGELKWILVDEPLCFV